MQKALYYLEDRLTYSAALSRIAFVQRRIGRLSLIAGLTGDMVGELRQRMSRHLGRSRGGRHSRGIAGGM